VSRHLILALSAAALVGLATSSARADGPKPRPSVASKKLLTVKKLGAEPLKSSDALVAADLEELAGQLREHVMQLIAQLPERVARIVANIREAPDRMKAANDLKQIGVAIHNYASANNDVIVPYAIFDKKGNPLLSWRVALLPYLEQDSLYKQFKLDEPWDSKNNKPLLEKMPKVYAPARGKYKEGFSTHYRVFTGKDALFDAKGKNPFKIGNVPDGTSNTIAVVEAGEAVPWTKPDELEYDAKKALPKLGGQFRDVFPVLLLDGSVRMAKKTANEQTLRNLITPADGNAFGDDW